MQIRSRTMRSYWTIAALGFIPDVLLAWIAARWAGNGEFLFFFMGLYVVYLLIWVKNTIWSWTMFAIAVRKRMADTFFDELQQGNFPEPDMYTDSGADYLQSVANADALPTATRIKAASLQTFVEYPAAVGQVQQAIRMKMSFEDALERYKRRFVTSAAPQPA